MEDFNLYLVTHEDVKWIVVAVSKDEAKYLVVNNYFEDEELFEKLEIEETRPLSKGVVADISQGSLYWF